MTDYKNQKFFSICLTQSHRNHFKSLIPGGNRKAGDCRSGGKHPSGGCVLLGDGWETESIKTLRFSFHIYNIFEIYGIIYYIIKFTPGWRTK